MAVVRANTAGWASAEVLGALVGGGAAGAGGGRGTHAAAGRRAMTMRREMTTLTEDARSLLEGVYIAHLATLVPDGAPHVVPVWVAIEGDRIVFHTDPRSRKARNIARDPRVAISITDQQRPGAMAHIRGRVLEVRDDDAAWAVLDRLSITYIGRPYPDHVDRMLFVVEPEHAWAYEFT